MMLATWLVEIYLSKCNELDDVVASEPVSNNVDNVQTERTITEEDLRQFLETYKVVLFWVSKSTRLISFSSE
jgi:vacuolar protein sorting-associated protein 18